MKGFKERKKKNPPGRHTEAGEKAEQTKHSTTERVKQQPVKQDRSTVSFVDDRIIVELAWNLMRSCCDFLVFDRKSRKVHRSNHVDLAHGRLVVPSGVEGIVTPGLGVRGAVFVPTESKTVGSAMPQLRRDIRRFIEKYVVLPMDTVEVAITYVLMSWVYDSIDELPYLAFRTFRSGTGKSRALETIGKLCYRPLFCGGGSSAPAIFRLIDNYGGTLVVDEFDHERKTELASNLTKILNQGFQQGRPLLRCEGEKFTPTPFNVFGPKVFVLREGFHDDATESRTISIRMKRQIGRTVPISLPRYEFDREVLELRNRLVMFRFLNLGNIEVNEIWYANDLEDRYNQIAAPLFAVAGSDTVRRQIVDVLKRQQAELAVDRSESEAGEVFAAVLAISDSKGFIRPGRLASHINQQRAEDDGVNVDRLGFSRMSARKVAHILLRELELPRDGKDADGAIYGLPPDRLEELRDRFGLASENRKHRQNRHSKRKGRGVHE